MKRLKFLFMGICSCYLLTIVACRDDDSPTADRCTYADHLSTQITDMLKDMEDGSWLGIETNRTTARVLAITDSAELPAKLAIRFYRLLIKGELTWSSLNTTIEDWDVIPETFIYQAQTPDGKATVTLTGSKSEKDANDCFATLTFNIQGLTGKLEEIRFAGNAYLDKIISEERARWYSIGYGYSWEGLPIELHSEADTDVVCGQIICMKKLRVSNENSSTDCLNVTQEELDSLLRTADLPRAVLLAAVHVESGGYVQPDSVPRIFFEGHRFWQQLKARKIDPNNYAADHPDVLYPKWDKKKYRDGKGEYDRLNEACEIEKWNESLNAQIRDVAYQSTTWGKYQFIGSLYADCGEPSVFTFADKMRGEFEQTLMWIEFLKKRDWLKYLQAKDWKGFAKAYNGKDYSFFKYDERLKSGYNRYVQEENNQ